MSQVIVESKGQPYTQKVTARDHEWSADEPIESGGKNAGPSPYQMLLGALGSCTAITVQMYARRKEWPLERVRVALSHQRVHARDCSDCESKEGFVSRIDLEISFTGELTAEQRNRLLEIAGKCPVKKTLAGEVLIRSAMVE